MNFEEQLAYVINNTSAELVWQNPKTLPDGSLYYIEPDKSPPSGSFLSSERFAVESSVLDALLEEEGVQGSYYGQYSIAGIYQYVMHYEEEIFDQKSDAVHWLMDQLERFSIIVQSFGVEK